MQIQFFWIGKTKDNSYTSVLSKYEKRLKHYCKVSIKELKEINSKNLSSAEVKKKESDFFIKELKASDYMVLLDERGRLQTSRQYSEWLQHKMNISIHRIVFVIAGPFGAHQELKDRADFTLSLSHMTMTHDMARMFIMEQTYRGFTILKGEKYHND